LRLEREKAQRDEERFKKIEIRRLSLEAAQPDSISQTIFPDEESFKKLKAITELCSKDEPWDEERWDRSLDEIKTQIVLYRQTVVGNCFKAASGMTTDLPGLKEFVSTQGFDLGDGEYDYNRQLSFLLQFDYLFDFSCAWHGGPYRFPQCPPTFADLFWIDLSDRRINIILQLIRASALPVNDRVITLHDLDNLGDHFVCHHCKDRKKFSWNKIVSAHFPLSADSHHRLISISLFIGRVG
jgi:hypothetical protein